MPKKRIQTIISTPRGGEQNKDRQCNLPNTRIPGTLAYVG